MTTPSTPSQPTPTHPSHPAYTLLTRSHPPSTASQIFTSKILHKPLLLTPTPHHQTSTSRSLRRHIRAHKSRYALQHSKPRPLSAKEKRSLNLYSLPASEVKYSIYMGLNRLWHGYILEVLGFTDQNGEVVADHKRKTVTQMSHGSLLASADFHGMEVEVVRCADVGRVGTRGIVVRETKGTVVVVTPRDEKRTVLKRGAVFRVVVELPVEEKGSKVVGEEKTGEEIVGKEDAQKRKLVFELHGSQLEVRPVERAVRKFKWRTMDYL